MAARECRLETRRYAPMTAIFARIVSPKGRTRLPLPRKLTNRQVLSTRDGRVPMRRRTPTSPSGQAARTGHPLASGTRESCLPSAAAPGNPTAVRRYARNANNTEIPPFPLKQRVGGSSSLDLSLKPRPTTSGEIPKTTRFHISIAPLDGSFPARAFGKATRHAERPHILHPMLWQAKVTKRQKNRGYLWEASRSAHGPRG